jgi:hypothetical protein
MNVSHYRSSGCVIRFTIALVIAGSLATTLLRAGAPPNLLDDNRGNVGLALTETAAFNLAVATAGLIADPLTFTYAPIAVEGRVLHNPKIHNLYLDDNWDANNPDAPTKEQLDTFTKELVSSGYFSAAAQYGVGGASFTGSHQSSVLPCGPLEPIAGHAEFVDLLAWVTCEVGFNPLPVPGFFPALSGVPRAEDDSLYVVYLPRSVTIVDGGCDKLSGYHFFGAVPKIVDLVVPVSQTFAFAVIPTACAKGTTPDAIRNAITTSASHEIIEASTDPLVGTGWINDSIIAASATNDFYKTLINTFNNVSTDLKAGEAADICELGGTLTGPPAFQHPTAPIPIPASDPSLGASFSVAPYWANQQNACAPFVPKSTLTLGTPSFPPAFVTSATVLTINAVDGGSGQGVASISFRFFPQGTTPPAFTTQAPPVNFSLTGADGPYTVQMFATGNDGIVEATQSTTVVLDTTAPVITIVQPMATAYPHSAVLTLDYSATDGAGSGVATLTATLDGSSTLNGVGLPSGRAINLLLQLPLGPHSFSVQSTDHVNNSSIKSVPFSIVVTAESIKDDVNIFTAAGMIKVPGLPTSLLAKLDNAAALRATGNCDQAANLYQAFIDELQAQSGTGVDPVAAAIMIADAQYLIAHCP